MRYVRAFFRFWYDFLVGDRWELFVGPIAALVLAWLAARAGLAAPVTGGTPLRPHRGHRGHEHRLGAATVTFLQAIVLGVLQGVTELFPISSLGHSVILPKLLGWDDVVVAQSATESYFLAFLVGFHVATALALLVSCLSG